MSTLLELRTRVLLLLLDTGSAIFTADLIDESLKQALHDYSGAYPAQGETVITLPAAGREIALDDIEDILDVVQVWWPYEYDKENPPAETWTPNRVRGWHVYIDDARPVLFLDRYDGDQPQEDDQMRIWFTRLQTIQDLDEAAVTSVRADHETALCLAAAGYAALSRTLDLTETAGTDLYAMALMATWGNAKVRAWLRWLDQLRAHQVRLRGQPGPAGWTLDKWDERSGVYPGGEES